MMWLIYALLSAITGGFVAVFTKICVRDIDPTLIAIVRSVIASVFLVGIGFFLKQDATKLIDVFSYNRSFMMVIFSGIFGGLSWFFYATALKYGLVIKVVTIDKLSLLFTIILSSLFLGEVLTVCTLIGAGLIIVGTLLITLT